MAGRLPDLAPDVLIARLSWRPDFTLNYHPYMISIPDEPIKPTILLRTLASSLGLLDTLPIELLHVILNWSDFQTLLRFARVCHHAKALVDSLLSYRDLMKHASTTLIALSRSQLITVHAAGTIHAALLSEKCVVCQKFCSFLFLPTCQRCCYFCLQGDRSLRVITTQMAGLCFGVSKKDLGQIPIMRGIPGKYAAGWKIKSRHKVSLFSLEQVEKLGISVHGSQDAMKRVFVSKIRKFRTHDRLLARWVSGATSDSEPRLPRIFDEDFGTPPDSFGGVASMLFPSLRPNDELENGLWCLGCREVSKRRWGFRPHGYYWPIPNYAPLSSSTKIFLSEMEWQARSSSEFLEHLKECEGRSIEYLFPCQV